MLDQRSLSTNSAFNYYFTGGSGVHVYMLDTGVDCGHDEFDTVTCSSSSYQANSSWGGAYVDAVGHGTRMASLAVGSSTGIARTATLHSVKVGNSVDDIDPGDVQDGVEWILANAPAASVVNVSLTIDAGTLSDWFKNAINSLASSNISVVVGAGNGGSDNIGDDTQSLGFCDLHSAVIVVSAVNAAGHRPSYANYGSCVDLFSPGYGLRAAISGTSGNYTDASGGTSSATALVSGIVATILQQRSTAGVGDIFDQVLGTASSGILVTIGSGSPNLLANSIHLFYPSITGPTSIDVTTAPVQATWNVSPTGGNGTYTYEWKASLNGGAWSVVSTSSSYTRTIPRFSEYNLQLKVTVSSAGESYIKPYNLAVAVTCGGC
ncbi:MAG: S8 family serine peptidase [Gemmatimonadales bacterium]|nr:S8 family serine peptidase [Gemmatimonadales bacterium]